jgi:Glycosyl transferases group 1
MTSPRVPRRITFLSAVNVKILNGNLQRQLQVLKQLTSDPNNLVEILSLHSTPESTQDWLMHEKLQAQVINTMRARFARYWYLLWYYGNSLLCVRLGWLKFFRFLPFPFEVLHPQIARAISFYLWPACILGLHRRRKWHGRLTIDLNDVMGDRHSRTGHRSWITIAPGLESQLLRDPGIDCVAITPNDSQLFDTIYGAQPRVWPFLPAEPIAKLPAAVNRTRAIGYFAAKNTQNEEFINFLVNHNVVKAWTERGLSVLLAGSGSDSLSDHIRGSFLAQGGELIGRVDSLADFYGRIQVALNPVGPSTGVKIKSVEALVHGCSLVTSRWGTDSLLNDFFSNRLHVIPWPLEAKKLIEAGLQAMFFAPTESPQCDDALVHYKAQITGRLLPD